MKEIVLHINDEMLFDELLESLSGRGVDILFKKNKTKYSLVIHEDDFLMFLNELSFYLITQAFFKHTEQYSDDIKSELEVKVFNTDYFFQIMLIELMKYFNNNTVLKENVFMNFNIKGFKGEMESLVDDFEMKSELLEFKKMFLSHLADNDIDLDKYKILRADYKNGFIEFATLDGERFDEMSFNQKFGVNLKVCEDDNDSVAFCWFVCSFLDVEKVILSDNFKDFQAMFELRGLLEKLNIEMIME